MLLPLLVAGCLIPPPLEKEGNDGGPNRAPQILWDIIQPKVGDLPVYQTAPGKKKVSERFVIALYDPDPQTVYLNAFLDGIKDNYAKPFKTDQTPPTNNGNRSFIFDLDGLCDELVNYVPTGYSLEFYISDSGFLTEGDQGQREPNPGGQVRSILWRLNCLLPPPSLDGGV